MLKGVFQLLNSPLLTRFKKKPIEVETSFARVTWPRTAAAVDYMGPLILPSTCLARVPQAKQEPESVSKKSS